MYGKRILPATTFAVLSLLGACDELESPVTPTGPAREASLAVLSDGAETRLTTATTGQVTPVISGDLVVFGELKTNDYDIHGLTLGGAPLSLAAAGMQQNPDVDGSLVVWEDRRHPATGVYAYDVAAGREFRVDTIGNQPAVSGGKVVYRIPSGTWYTGGNSIAVFDRADSTRTILYRGSSYLGRPDISGSRVVWEDLTNALTHDWDIVLHDLNGGGRTVLTRPGSQRNPSISGTRVAYETGGDIYVVDVLTGVETRLTHDAAKQQKPRIDGDLVVWEDYRNGSSNADVYAHDLATETEYRLTTSTSQQYTPQVSGRRIVWHDLRHGQADVYMHTLP